MHADSTNVGLPNRTVMGEYAQLAQADTAIGRFLSATGTVRVSRDGSPDITAQDGTPVFQNDLITTGPSSAAEIEFEDGSSISVAENGEAVLDSFVYQPDTGAGDMSVSFVKGVFSFASGSISKSGFETMDASTPVATMGIRGTVGLVGAGEEGTANTFIVVEGEIAVRNAAGEVILSEPLESTTVVSFNLPPSEPVVLTLEEIQNRLPGLGSLAASVLQQIRDALSEIEGEGEENEENTDIDSEEIEELDQGALEFDVLMALQAQGISERINSLPVNEFRKLELNSLGFYDFDSNGFLNNFLNEFTTLKLTGTLEDGALAGPITISSTLVDDDEDVLLLDSPDNEGSPVAMAGPIIGTAGDDFLVGGPGADVIRGGSGNDTIIGGGGGDMLSGDLGNDSVFGQTEDDSIFGGGDADFLEGGSGNDLILGGDGWDEIFGGAGDDVIDGEAGNDTISGGDGNDVISGGDGNDVISGGDGEDVIEGWSGNDTISGGNGNDMISGGIGNDTLSGNGGGDTIDGGSGNDLVSGGGGNDAIIGGPGDDVITGDGGNDVISGDGGNDTISGGDGNDVIDGGSDFGDISVSTGVSITFSGSDAGQNNSLGYYFTDADGNPTAGAIIWAEIDTLEDGTSVTIEFDSAAEAESIGFFLIPDGGDLNATLTDGTEVTFQQNDDGEWQVLSDGNVLDGAGQFAFFSDVELNFDEAEHFLFGPDGAVAIEDQPVPISDEDFDDVLLVVETVDGTNITGFGDQLFGGNGNDIIDGGSGDDLIVGGSGADVLTGGLGTDVFRYDAITDSTVGNPDTITDFDATDPAEDIFLSGLLSGSFNFLGTGGSFSGTGNTEARFDDASKLLEIDQDGDGTVDMEIELAGVSGADLDVGDFTVT